jgi:hypothetical protein
VALALLHSNRDWYTGFPDQWIEDATELTEKLLTATDLYARKDMDGTQDT